MNNDKATKAPPDSLFLVLLWSGAAGKQPASPYQHLSKEGDLESRPEGQASSWRTPSKALSGDGLEGKPAKTQLT